MSIEVGEKVVGKITGITHFGAFVSLPNNKTGLIHISEISDQYIKDINSVLSVGLEVEVKVLTIAADGKISLSLRQAQENAQPSSTTARPAPTRDGERKFSKPPQADRGPRSFNKRKDSGSHGSSQSQPKEDSFDSLMSGFLKDSEDRLSSIRRNTEGKRGGRGGRRS